LAAVVAVAVDLEEVFFSPEEVVVVGVVGGLDLRPDQMVVGLRPRLDLALK
jgi:hypothetical protein